MVGGGDGGSQAAFRSVRARGVALAWPALADGRDAGCVNSLLHPNHLWLDELYIAPSLQSRGLESRVLRLILLEAATERLPIRMSVLTTNPALAFYRRHGFRVDRETKERRYLTSGQPR